MIKWLLKSESGQDVAEYAVMLAVILAIAIGTIRYLATSTNPIWKRAAQQISGQSGDN